MNCKFSPIDYIMFNILMKCVFSDTNDLHASRLFIGVYANLKKGPKFLGKAAVPLGNVKDNETVDQWYKVEKRSKKRPSGLSPCIRIKMEFVRRVPEVVSYNA